MARRVPRTGCVIGHDTWIGANVTILAGCGRIGQGAVIGAGSVVTKDVPDFAIALGNPATVRKLRLSVEQRARLHELDYGALTPSELIRLAETTTAPEVDESEGDKPSGTGGQH